VHMLTSGSLGTFLPDLSEVRSPGSTTGTTR
jgi:hypothetical protein